MKDDSPNKMLEKLKSAYYHWGGLMREDEQRKVQRGVIKHPEYHVPLWKYNDDALNAEIAKCGERISDLERKYENEVKARVNEYVRLSTAYEGATRQLENEQREVERLGKLADQWRMDRAQALADKMNLEKALADANRRYQLQQPVKVNEASVAMFLDYLEAFYESLESAIEEVENYERTYRKSPSSLPKITQQYEGLYGCSSDVFFKAMGYLIKLLYETMRKGAESEQGAWLLTQLESYNMFKCAAIHSGFALTLLINFGDLPTNLKLPGCTSFDNYTRLLDFTNPLSGEEWDRLQSAAMQCVASTIRYSPSWARSDIRDEYSFRYVSSFFEYGGIADFSYHRTFTKDEIDTIVSEVIRGEIPRFQRFLEALHSTLRFLAYTQPLAQMKIKPPVFDWNNRREALDIFRDMIQLLRTIANKQEVIPQESLTTLVVGRVRPPLNVTLQVRKEEHTGNVHTYHLTLTDSKHLSEPVQFLLNMSESGEAELFEDDSNG